MSDLFDLVLFATTFTTLLVIQDPLGAVPVFLSLTGRQDYEQRKRSAFQATLVSFSVVLVFAVFGRYILRFLGISVPALQLSGGLLLLLVAVELLTGKIDDAPASTDPVANSALVPLGTPLLAGPGAIVAAMVAVESATTPVAGWAAVSAAIVCTHLVIFLTLRSSLTLHRMLGDSAIRVITRVLGLLLAAIAVEMMADGVFGFVELRLEH
ncbi:MarC family protein [Actinomyces trachealis]|uniref:MarC family protein n=1 Tax=Actinomyces trachealis TaxID=2763540 RepID=UPI001892A134|nr:MarC family protein [Actinomyces trachealis]